MSELYPNTWLHFKARGDASEIFEQKLPTPHYYNRALDSEIYSIAWLICGYFGTEKGRAYLNDIIARIALNLPVIQRYDFKPKIAKEPEPIKLAKFGNAQSLKNERKRAERANSLICHDTTFWALKFEAERRISASGGWFNYGGFEAWAFGVFVIGHDVKDKSTLKAKCRSVWHWYEERNFKRGREKVSTMSRQEGAAKAREKLQRAKEAKVKGAIEALKFLQEKITVSGVARQAGVSRNTAAKYMQQIGII